MKIMMTMTRAWLLGFILLLTVDAQLRASPGRKFKGNSTLDQSNERRLQLRIKAVGDNGNPANRFPLGLCEGDCDSDADCAGELVCQQRGPQGAVRGCSGGESDNTRADYCVLPLGGPILPPASAPSSRPTTVSSTIPTDAAFRLKMYWEQGYDWQEEYFERKWCAMYDYDGLPGDGKCWYGSERTRCQPDQLYISKCSEDSRQYFRFVRIAANLVQFKLANERNLCFESGPNQRQGGVKQIFLRPCNVNNPNQQWFAQNGSFDGYRWEASQYVDPSLSILTGTSIDRSSFWLRLDLSRYFVAVFKQSWICQ